ILKELCSVCHEVVPRDETWMGVRDKNLPLLRRQPVLRWQTSPVTGSPIDEGPRVSRVSKYVETSRQRRLDPHEVSLGGAAVNPDGKAHAGLREVTRYPKGTCYPAEAL